jgi:DNA-binding response OmpR family regulator
MIFILDDDMDRIKRMQKWLGKDNVMYAQDPEAARPILENNEFKVIFLDHDLGGPYTRGPKGDGIDLAIWMRDEAIAASVPVVVHSLNVYGAKNIRNTLQDTHDVIVKPFVYLTADMVREMVIGNES